ncbi:MAG TPA: glycosyltransferase family 2 protein [Azospira sp.]|nr:glycosyltransferase family 2 protein [Azospira sp.]
MPPLTPPPGSPVSAVLITLNAAGQLEACLSSLSFADEIVIVDSGSSDATLEIAVRHGARVIRQEWLGFGPQKQFAVSQARHDWVFCIDADEKVTPELALAIEAALREPRFQAYRVPRCNRFLGRFLRHGEGYPDWNLRLFHRDHARWSDDRVHEHVQTTGAVGALAGDLLHDSAETLESYLAKQNRYTSLAAEAALEAGKRTGVGRLLLSPLFRFFKFYVLRRGFLDGMPGLVHTLIGCMNSFTKYAKMLDLQQRRSSRP